MANSVAKSTKLKRKFFRAEKSAGLIDTSIKKLSPEITLSPEQRRFNQDEQSYLKSLKSSFDFVPCKVEYEVSSNARGIVFSDFRNALQVINTINQNMIKSKTMDQVERVSFVTTAVRDEITILCDLEFNSDASMTSLEHFSRSFLRENFKKLKECRGSASSNVHHKVIAQKTVVTLVIEYALEERKSVENKINENRKVPFKGQGEKQW